MHPWACHIAGGAHCAAHCIHSVHKGAPVAEELSRALVTPQEGSVNHQFAVLLTLVPLRVCRCEEPYGVAQRTLEILAQAHSPRFSYLVLHLCAVPFQAVHQPGLPVGVDEEAAVQALLAVRGQADGLPLHPSVAVLVGGLASSAQQRAEVHPPFLLVGQCHYGIVVSLVIIGVGCPPVIHTGLHTLHPSVLSQIYVAHFTPHLQVAALVGFQRHSVFGAPRSDEIVQSLRAVNGDERVSHADAFLWDVVFLCHGTYGCEHERQAEQKFFLHITDAFRLLYFRLQSYVKLL